MKLHLALLLPTFAILARAADPVEASAAMRKALADGAPMTLLVPASIGATEDPFGELHTELDKEVPRKGSAEFLAEAVAGKAHDLNALRAVLADAATLQEHVEKKDLPELCGSFSPDVAVSWPMDGKTVHALYSYTCGEITFQAEEKILHYDIAPPAYPKLMKATEGFTAEWSRPVPLAKREDAAPLLALLKDGSALEFMEDLPRKGTPAYEEAMLDAAVEEIGGHAFHASFPVSKTLRDQLRDRILANETFEVWSGEKECEGFHPDYALRWGVSGIPEDLKKAIAAGTMEEAELEKAMEERGLFGEPVDLQICFTCSEVIFLQGDKSLRYDLGAEALGEFKKLLPTAEANGAEEEMRELLEQRRKKAVPVAATQDFRETLAAGAEMTIHEGLPHPAEDLFDELKRKDVEKIAGHAFYTPAQDGAKASELRKILGDAKVAEPYGGAKECGEFHPDYAVSWKTGGKTVYFLACFGCGEIEYLSEGKATRYDMGELREPMTEALEKFRLKRPVPKAER